MKDERIPDICFNKSTKLDNMLEVSTLSSAARLERTLREPQSDRLEWKAETAAQKINFIDIKI